MADQTPTTAPPDGLRALRVSPAAHLAEILLAGSTLGVVELTEVPFLTMIGLRVAAGTATAERIERVLGALPARSGDVSGTGSEAVIWLGPQEFLVVAAAEAHVELGGDLENRLREAIGDDGGQVVDLSANRTTFELTGERALAVLQKGCSLDMHPREFAVGSAVATEVGGIAVILWRTAENSYRLLPRASFSEFAARWLLDGMREFSTSSA